MKRTKILIKRNHLAYVNTDLMISFRRKFSIVNFVAWIKEQSIICFSLPLNDRSDILTLQKKTEEIGFSSIGEWIDCMMREKLNLWPIKTQYTGERENEQNL